MAVKYADKNDLIRFSITVTEKKHIILQKMT